MNINTKLKNNMLGNVGFAGSFTGGMLELRSGPRPATADSAASGVLIAVAKPSGGEMTFSATGGAVFANESWDYVTIATGTIGHARLVGPQPDNGAANADLPRADFNVVTSGEGLRLVNNVVREVGQTGTVAEFTFRLK